MKQKERECVTIKRFHFPSSFISSNYSIARHRSMHHFASNRRFPARCGSRGESRIGSTPASSASGSKVGRWPARTKLCYRAARCAGGGGGRGRNGGRAVVGSPVRGNFPHLLPNNSHGNEVTAMVSAK